MAPFQITTLAPSINFERQASNTPRQDSNSATLQLYTTGNLIEEYLSEGTEYKEDDGADAGPMTELDYWRRRMQRLTSITEQLKTKECKTVIGVLSSLTKNPQDMNRQKIFGLLRRRARRVLANCRTPTINTSKIASLKTIKSVSKQVDSI